MKKTLNLKDKTQTRLRLIQTIIGTLFLGAVVFLVPLKETGYMAIPAILIPAILIGDGLLRFLVLKNGISINTEEGTLTYPQLYKMKQIHLCEIHTARPAFKVHSGAQFGSSTYTYDIDLHGEFGIEVLIFASEKARDEVLHTLREVISTEEAAATSS